MGSYIYTARAGTKKPIHAPAPIGHYAYAYKPIYNYRNPDSQGRVAAAKEAAGYRAANKLNEAGVTLMAQGPITLKEANKYPIPVYDCGPRVRGVVIDDVEFDRNPTGFIHADGRRLVYTHNT